MQYRGRKGDDAKRPTPGLGVTAPIILDHQPSALADQKRVQAIHLSVLLDPGQALRDIL